MKRIITVLLALSAVLFFCAAVSAEISPDGTADAVEYDSGAVDDVYTKIGPFNIDQRFLVPYLICLGLSLIFARIAGPSTNKTLSRIFVILCVVSGFLLVILLGIRTASGLMISGGNGGGFDLVTLLVSCLFALPALLLGYLVMIAGSSRKK